jgi:hypothetical protein
MSADAVSARSGFAGNSALDLAALVILTSGGRRI